MSCVLKIYWSATEFLEHFPWFESHVWLFAMDSPGQNTRVGSHSLLQGIFSTLGSDPGLPHYRRILYQLRLCLIPGLERSPGEGNSYWLQYSGLVTKSWTGLSDFHCLYYRKEKKQHNINWEALHLYQDQTEQFCCKIPDTCVCREIKEYCLKLRLAKVESVGKSKYTWASISSSVTSFPKWEVAM